MNGQLYLNYFLLWILPSRKCISIKLGMKLHTMITLPTFAQENISSIYEQYYHQQNCRMLTSQS